MALPKGSYIVFGQHAPCCAEPQVHLLDAVAHASFDERRSVAESTPNGMREVYRLTFGMPDADTAIPAWSVEALTMIAQGYVGQHQTAVRGLAAAIALGRPFSRDKGGKPDKGSDGGTRVKPETPPKGPSGGDAVPAGSSAFGSLLGGS